MRSHSTIYALARKDRLASHLLATIAAISASLLLLVLLFLLIQSWPALHLDILRRFLGSDGWYPLEGSFGMVPMFVGTLAVGIGALALAVPLGVLTAIFSLSYAPRPLARVMDLIVNLLAGIPSVIFGLWGLTCVVPIINVWRAPGASLLAAILVLALMILPTVAVTSRFSLAALVPLHRQAAASLSLSRSTTILYVLLPPARSGIVAGVLLALARAFGETMAVLMVAGNVVQIPASLFDPLRVFTANIALEMGYAADVHKAALFASGIALMVLVGLTTSVAHLLDRATFGNL